MTPLPLVPTGQFKRDAKKQLAALLTGDFKDYRECHVKPDLLLVYAKRGGELHLARLATHSELFG